MAKRRPKAAASRSRTGRQKGTGRPVRTERTGPDRVVPPPVSDVPVTLARDSRSGGTWALAAVGLTYVLAFGIWFLATRPETVARTGPTRAPASYVVTTENTGSVQWWRVPTVVPSAALPPPPALVSPSAALPPPPAIVSPAPGAMPDPPR